MDFDEIIERRGTHSSKWDGMEKYSGVSPDDGIPMWVADMDFRPPQVVRDAFAAYVDHGLYGYFGDDSAYLNAVAWWAEHRHGWKIDTDAVFSTHGLVNGAALCVQSWTRPGDGVILFTPVYHAFQKVIKAAGRAVVECPLALNNGRYEMDFDAYDAQLTGREKMVVLCSPHNPGGRCWTASELKSLADFCVRHDLILVSDEIHCDLVMPGHRHVPMAIAAPEAIDRIVMMTATSKTFNLAGAHTGNVIVPDPVLRETFAATMAGLGLSPNAVGRILATAAYGPEGAQWVDALMVYLAENKRILEEGLAKIPGVKPMPLEATYLAWVDFADTGMTREEVMRRIASEARIAVNQGPSFGAGGETFNRFNFATPRVRVVEAVARMQAAFSDLQ